MIESTLEAYLIKKCKDNNIFICKNTGMNGMPDRLILKNGKHFFIELKKPGDKPRELQTEIIKRMENKGAIVHVIDSKEGIDDIIEEINRKDKRKKYGYRSKFDIRAKEDNIL